jgi:dCMP deaminase
MDLLTDIEYLRVAYRVAESSSDDQSTHNGAVLVYDGRIIAAAANGFPRGIEGTPERQQRPLKYAVIEHAERNAIYEAARLGRMTAGATMYCPWSVCADCARAIIQAGITRLVSHHAQHRPTRPDWKESLAIADQMLREAGVKHDEIDADLGVTVLFNREVLSV